MEAAIGSISERTTLTCHYLKHLCYGFISFGDEFP